MLVPWPLLVFADAFVPAARYVLLAAAATSVAVFEGASGPVGMIVVLLVAMALATTTGCWLLAWGIAKSLGRLSPTTQRAVTWALLALGLLIGLLFEPYRTTMGRAPSGGLLDLLS